MSWTFHKPYYLFWFLVFNCASFAAMNARMSSDMSSSFSHCSLYKGYGEAAHAINRDRSLFAYFHPNTGGSPFFESRVTHSPNQP